MRRSVADANKKESEMKTTIAWKIAMLWMITTEERIRRAKFKIADLDEKWERIVKGYIRAANLMGYEQDAEVLMEMLEQQQMCDEFLARDWINKYDAGRNDKDEESEAEAIMVSISTTEALKCRIYRALGWDKPIPEKSVGIPGW